jgi:hypothetical protein
LNSWQLRFLVNVHDFFERENSTSLKDTDPQISQICENYLQKIRHHICSSVTFLIYVDFHTPFERMSHIPEVEGHQVAWGWTSDTSTYYYIMISIWYVMSNCPKSLELELPDSPIRLALSTHISSLSSVCNPLSKVIDRENEAKVKLLRWYHNASIMKIKERLQGKAAYQMTDEAKELQREIETNRQSAHEAMSASARKTVEYMYTDEICDRLAFLARELGLVDPISDSCISLAQNRLSRRDWTSTMDFGRYWRAGPWSFRIFTSSPWEIYALCHQSHLLFWKTLDESEVFIHRRRCYNFLTSETSIVESWERNNSDTIESWFHLDATCIFASALLEIRKRQPKSGKIESSNELKNQAVALELSTEALQEHNDPKMDNQMLSSIDVPRIQEGQAFKGTASPYGALIHALDGSTGPGIISAVLELLERQNNIGKDLRPPKRLAQQLNWTMYRPPFFFHPGSFVNSLDDSPYLYAPSETKKVQLRSEIQKYLTDNGEPLKVPDWATQPMEDIISPETLRYMSVVDVFRVGSQYSTRTTGRVSDGNLNQISPTPTSEPNSNTVLGQIRTVLNSLGRAHTLEWVLRDAVPLFAQFIDGDLVLRPDRATTRPISPELKTVYLQLPEDLKTKLGNEQKVQEAKIRLRGELLKVLRDSVSGPTVV